MTKKNLQKKFTMALSLKNWQKNHWYVNFAGILIKIFNSLHILCQSRWLILYIRISYMITNWAAIWIKKCLMPSVFVCLSFVDLFLWLGPQVGFFNHCQCLKHTRLNLGKRFHYLKFLNVPLSKLLHRNLSGVVGT